jgi:CheY-like chemotaxis protein
MSLAELGELESVHLTAPRYDPKVLVVEDESESEWLIASTLRSVRRNADLKWVKSAEEAEILLKAGEHYDLIIADHYLKGEKTGLDLWKSCYEKYRSIPFMMTSALSEKVFVRLAGPQLPRPVFLHKPIDVKECRSMIGWFLDKPRHISLVDVLGVEEDLGGSWPIGFAILAIISALVVSSKTDFPGNMIHKHQPDIVERSLTGNDFIQKPMRFVIPLFPAPAHSGTSDRSKKSSSSLIKKILSSDLRNKINEINERGREILIFSPIELEGPTMLDLPNWHKEVYEGTDGTFDKEFEKFKIIRVSG